MQSNTEFLTKEVRIGTRLIGGKHPILIQSMCNTRTSDIAATLRQIQLLQKNGCDIVRIAVASHEDIIALSEIRKKTEIPLVADIQFDYNLAIAALEHADKIRINPGNLGGHLEEVMLAAKSARKAIRIGVNMGSIEKDLLTRFGRSPEALVESAIRHVDFLESHGFNQIVVSLKSSDAMTTIAANRMFRERSGYPLHLGVTEAGVGNDGIIKSAIGIGTLLADNIGETIRVSLTEDPVEEVKAAKGILKALGLRKGRIMISCPTCSRTQENFIELVKSIESMTAHLEHPVKIAVMGCEVNGPGEAKDADVGVAFSKNTAYFFKDGEIVDKISNPANKAICEKILEMIG